MKPDGSGFTDTLTPGADVSPPMNPLPDPPGGTPTQNKAKAAPPPLPIPSASGTVTTTSPGGN